jgi:hypothetical protein
VPVISSQPAPIDSSWTGGVPLKQPERLTLTPEVSLPTENMLISEAAQAQTGDAQLQILLVEPVKEPLQAFVQGEASVVQATGELVGGVIAAVSDQLLNLPEPKLVPEQVPVVLQPDIQAGAKVIVTTPLVSDLDQISSPISADQAVKKGRDLLTGTLLTVQAIKDKNILSESAQPTVPAPLIKGISVATVAPIISSARTNFQALMANKKSVSQAVEAVAADTVGAVVTGTASQVGQRLVSAVAVSLKVPPPVAEAAGMVAAFTAGQLSNGVMDYSGFKTLVLDRARGWFRPSMGDG